MGQSDKGDCSRQANKENFGTRQTQMNYNLLESSKLSKGLNHSGFDSSTQSIS
jgi:hypothetical protein